MMSKVILVVLLATVVCSRSVQDVLLTLDPEVSRDGWEIDPSVTLVSSASDLSQMQDIVDLQPDVVHLSGTGLWVFRPNSYAKIQGDYQMTQANSATLLLRCYKQGGDKLMVRPLTDDGKLNCTVPAAQDGVQWYEVKHQISVHEVFVEAIFGPASFAVCDTIQVQLKDDAPQPINKKCESTPVGP